MDNFLPIEFPLGIGYGTVQGPAFKTRLTVLDSGYAGAVSQWTYPRRRYRLNLANRSADDLVELLNFYHVCQGRACGFLLTDQSDYSSASDHRGAVDDEDQIIEEIDGVYRLYKTYSAGSNPQIRLITRPKIDTVVLADDGTPVVATVDESTGIINYTPTGVLTAGFEFYTPVRFNSDLEYVLDEYNDASYGELELIELRPRTNVEFAAR